MRHASGRPATIGRANTQGPPLTWENDGSRRSLDSSDERRTGSSGTSNSSTSTIKGDLPPIPGVNAGTQRRYDQQATVRHAPSAVGVQREPSDEYDDYEGQYTNGVDSVAAGMGNVQLEDDVPDTTMLDSVILPAIASVSDNLLYINHGTDLGCSCSLA